MFDQDPSPRPAPSDSFPLPTRPSRRTLSKRMQDERPPGPRPALLYLRVSTTRQAVEGVSLDMQERMGREHAARLGLEVAGVFRDEVSGKDSIERRPALLELLKAQRALEGSGLEPVVIVYSIKRLARSVLTFAKLVSELGLSVSSITEPFDMSTPMGRAMGQMLAVFAELEGAGISSQTKDGLSEVTEQRLEFESQAAALESEGKLEEAAEKKALAMSRRLGGARKAMDTLPDDVLRLIHDLSEQGYTQGRIAEQLTARGIPTATGKARWGYDSVARALRVPRPK